MKILITGAAGFIGSYVTGRLSTTTDEVTAIDNLNNYYEIGLKLDRLSELGFKREEIQWNIPVISRKYTNLKFIRMSLEDDITMKKLFSEENFDYVCHLAAQAGVRYSLENPKTYIRSNIDGFLNILEGCRHYSIKHLVYASSSSVYGLNVKVPFSEKDNVDHPVSLYAVTKKSNELMAHSYSYLFGLPTTGLRFFTVYGPWGRPDMSPFLFIDSILRENTIKVFNNGDMLRDFTYIDDIVEGITRLINKIPESNSIKGEEFTPDNSPAPYKIYNIGNSTPVKLMDYIQTIEEVVGKEAKKIFLPMQPGDVYQTNADTTSLEKAIGFRPNTPLKEGITQTVTWFRNYYNL